MLTPEWIAEHVRPRFSRVLQRDQIYLASHSLGRPLDKTAEDLKEGLDLWYADMDDAWEAWIAESNRFRANVAKLIGHPRPDGIIPKSSAGQGLRAVLNAFPARRPLPVVTTRGEFDSVDFILRSYAGAGLVDITWCEPEAGGDMPLYRADSILNSLPAEPGLAVISLAFFGSGQILHGVEEITKECQQRGWLVLLDLYHAAGVIPLDFLKLGADFAIGGSYKYTRGGPGACWLAVHPRHLDNADLKTLDTGWFAKKNTFGYERRDEPLRADGGDGWLESTPSVLTPFQARAGLEFTLEIGVEALREYSLRQQASMRSTFKAAGAPLVEPYDPEHFGAFSLLRHSQAADFSRALKGKGLNTDARGQFVRFGPDLLNTEEELARAAELTAELLRSMPGEA